MSQTVTAVWFVHASATTATTMAANEANTRVVSIVPLGDDGVVDGDGDDGPDGLGPGLGPGPEPVQSEDDVDPAFEVAPVGHAVQPELGVLVVGVGVP